MICLDSLGPTTWPRSAQSTVLLLGSLVLVALSLLARAAEVAKLVLCDMVLESSGTGVPFAIECPPSCEEG